jgi:hypothetical protein
MTVRVSAVAAALVCAVAPCACGGSGSANEAAVTVRPSTAQLATLMQVTFTATVSGTADTTVRWSVAETGGGSVVDGRYTAPATPGVFHVVATSNADPTKVAAATVTVVQPAATVAEQLRRVSERGIYFAHQSVGGNIMDGVWRLLEANTGPEPVRVESTSAAEMGQGIWADSFLVSNYGDLSAKVAEFRGIIDRGVGAKVDVAFMKFCFADFWDAVDVPARFGEYQAMMAELRGRYPGVTFVHVTVPLWTDDPSNADRERMSDLIRSTYGGKEPVFDLALIESTRPDGTRQLGGGGIPAMVPAYTGDGGHLNTRGADLVAAKLVEFLANVP